MDAAAIIPLVVASGFVDGIHPCGIAVLLFFIAFLLYARKRKTELLAVGMAYVFGVFAAYLGIGLGIIGVFSLFPGHFMAKLGASLLMLIGAISLLEGISGKSMMRMPKMFTPKIEELLHKATVPAALGAGVLVGLCAFPCAGGIYVAIIGLLAAQGVSAEMLGYLVLYNLMFVLPLVLILLLASNRNALEWIGKIEAKSRNGMKIALGIAMLLAGILILMNTT